jgi:hypothetical protein
MTLANQVMQPFCAIYSLTEEADTSILALFSYVTANYPETPIRVIILFYAFNSSC